MITTEQIRHAAQEYASENLTEGAVYGSSNIAAAFASGADWALQQDNWIHVEEGIPEPDILVIIWTNAGMHEGTYIDNEWIVNNEVTEMTVTHWCPYPKPPKTKA